MSTDPDAQSTKLRERPQRAAIETARGEASLEALRIQRAHAGLERIAALALAPRSLDAFLPELAAALAQLAHCPIATLRVREGERMRTRAVHSLDDELSAGFTHPCEESAGAGLETLAVSDPRVSAAMRGQGINIAYYLPCRDGLGGDSVVAAVCFGFAGSEPLSAADCDVLQTLAPHVGAAVARKLEAHALEQSVRSRDQVLAVVAHDLRNPISVISMAANSLLKKVTDTLARRPLERIVRATQRADHLIEDLLRIDAIEGGRFTIQAHRVDTADVILAALESQQALAASASVIFATDLSPELPPVDGDAERLLEVLENLVGNAIKFTSPGGTVTVGATTRDDDILVWVKDTGSGIAQEQLPHLFDRFFQARKVDRRGTGLGLTICKAIVEAHGGRIWIDSTLGQGTTVSFSIPALAADRPRVHAAADRAGILIVDDRPENLLSLTAILERPEYRLLTAQSGEEALSLALREQFCVALIDIAMPGMNGLEVAQHLKTLERSRDIPIIFITAFGDDPQEIHRAYSAGGVDYLVKPLDTEIVRKKVAVFVDLSKRRRLSEHPR